MRARPVVRQNDFAFGEISPEHAAAGDRDAVSRSLKKGRDIRLLNSYGFANRFGSARLAKMDNQGIPTTLVLKDGTQLIGYLRPNGMDVYTTSGLLLQSIEGAPWGHLARLKQVTWLARVGELRVAHNAFPTQVFTYDDLTGLWSLADFAFDPGNGGSLQQLYHRFAPKGVTMKPSALTGDITVVFSADVLIAKHEGVIFRYAVVDGAGQEIRINSVTDARHATATVLNDLPPTVVVEVGDASGYVVGEEVKGINTTATGFVVDITGNFITVAMTRGFESFDDRLVDKDGNGSLDSGEYLVGEFTRSYIVFDSLDTSPPPAAIVAWDEAAVSPVHGYPGSVFGHDERVGFANFPDIPDGIALSAPGSPNGFDIGAGGPGDAMFEQLGQADGQRILFGVSAANLMILTTKAAFYVPQNTDVPLSAETFAPIKIAPIGCSPATPAVTAEGVIYIETGGNRVIGLLSTGSLTAPWKYEDLSKHAAHLISNPTSIASTNGSTQAAERYVMVMNDDGTVAVLFFDDEPLRLGWTLWSTDNGDYTAMTNIDGFLYTSCNRVIAHNKVTFLERFDADAQLDCSVAFGDSGTASNMVTGSGDAWFSGSGDQIVSAGAVAVAELAGATVAVNNGTAYLGTFTVNEDGTLDGLGNLEGSMEVGFHFNQNVVLWPQEPEGDTRPSFAKRHVPRVCVRVQASQSFQYGIATQGLPVTVPVYLPNDDQGQPPPLRSGEFRSSFLGWSDEPSVQILRPIPQPVKVLSVAHEVPF